MVMSASLLATAFSEYGLGFCKGWMAEVDEDIHSALSMGQGFSRFILAYESFGEAEIIQCDQFLTMDGFG